MNRWDGKGSSWRWKVQDEEGKAAGLREEREFVQRRMERREEQSWEQYKWRESDERVTQTLFRRRMERSEKWIFSMELSNFDLVVKESHYQDNSLWTKGG